MTPANRAGDPHAVIVGASLAGLMAALTLARAGMRVTLLERSDDTGRTGAALHVEHGLLEKITGHGATVAAPALATGVQTWFAVHAGLRAAVAGDRRIVLHQHTPVLAVGQDDASAWADSANGRFYGDIVIGADGHRSVVRRMVAPEQPDAQFAGYLIWLGVSQEADLPAPEVWPGEVAFLDSGAHLLLGYPLPGPGGSVLPGRRQLGAAWYDAGHNDLLRAQGCVQGSVVQHSLSGQDIPDAVYRTLAREAKKRWPAPWRDVMLECIARRAIIGTPIAEYLPRHLVNGRLALVGDAAHVPTPMTGKGFNASMEDALALARCVTPGMRGAAATQALGRYETLRLDSARSLVKSGQSFSRNFAAPAG